MWHTDVTRAAAALAQHTKTQTKSATDEECRQRVQQTLTLDAQGHLRELSRRKHDLEPATSHTSSAPRFHYGRTAARGFSPAAAVPNVGNFGWCDESQPTLTNTPKKSKRLLALCIVYHMHTRRQRSRCYNTTQKSALPNRNFPSLSFYLSFFSFLCVHVCTYKYTNMYIYIFVNIYRHMHILVNSYI